MNRAGFYLRVSTEQTAAVVTVLKSRLQMLILRR
jgi:hypothetical protein